MSKDNSVKVLVAVYHDTNSNGRCQQLLHCAERLGDGILVSYRPVDTWKLKSETKVVVTGSGKRKYGKFVLDSIKTIKNEKPDIIIIHDNYCAILIPYIYMLNPRPYIVYDSSELYIDKKFRNDKKAYLIQMMENRFLNKSDFIISANLERAKLMRQFFRLKKLPYVFENIRKIDDVPDIKECERKFGEYLSTSDFIVLYAGGVSENRMTYELIRAVKKLGKGYRLLLAGYKAEKENQLYEEAMRVTDDNNVFYLGYLKRSELRYLFGKIGASVSMFRQTTLNNINCASGKFYESLFEECPVLTGTNPPLKRICEQYGIGVSTDDLEGGIKMLKEGYETYRANVREYIKNLNIENNIDMLADKIRESYKAFCNLESRDKP